MARGQHIATGIWTHLRRFERDPEINHADPKYKTRPYYMPYARASGNRIFVTYITYQGSNSLTFDELMRDKANLEALENWRKCPLTDKES